MRVIQQSSKERKMINRKFGFRIEMYIRLWSNNIYYILVVYSCMSARLLSFEWFFFFLIFEWNCLSGESFYVRQVKKIELWLITGGNNEVWARTVSIELFVRWISLIHHCIPYYLFVVYSIMSSLLKKVRIEIGKKYSECITEFN